MALKSERKTYYAPLLLVVAALLTGTFCNGFVSTNRPALRVSHHARLQFQAPAQEALHCLDFNQRRCVSSSQREWKTWRRYAVALDAASSPSNRRSIVSASVFVLLDVFFRRSLRAMSVSFPSSLAGCGVLFASMLAFPKGDKLYDALRPGSALLAKWLPLFFVPSLVTLPLSDGLGSAGELVKVALVVVGGFYFTLLTTAGSVLSIRKLRSSTRDEDETPAAKIVEDLKLDKVVDESSPPPKAFSARLLSRLQILTIATATGALAASDTASSSALGAIQAPLLSAFLLCTTLWTFVFGARLPKKFTKVVHPLVTCTTLTWLSAKAFGALVKTQFHGMLKLYRKNNLSIMGAGAGDILLFLLGPAVVSLACQMYDRRKLMRENLAEVATGVSVSAFGGLFGTAAAVRLLDIGNPLVRLSLLSRNITSPLAMAIASILGTDVSMAVSMVVVTGLIGANFGASILDSFGIKDAVARGLSIGAAAHGLGTAAFANEENAFPFAAIAMALTASACTVLVSVPLIQRLVMQLALGV